MHHENHLAGQRAPACFATSNTVMYIKLKKYSKGVTNVAVFVWRLRQRKVVMIVLLLLTSSKSEFKNIFIVWQNM